MLNWQEIINVIGIHPQKSWLSLWRRNSDKSWKDPPTVSTELFHLYFTFPLSCSCYFYLFPINQISPPELLWVIKVQPLPFSPSSVGPLLKHNGDITDESSTGRFQMVKKMCFCVCSVFSIKMPSICTSGVKIEVLRRLGVKWRSERVQLSNKQACNCKVGG